MFPSKQADRQHSSLRFMCFQPSDIVTSEPLMTPQTTLEWSRVCVCFMLLVHGHERGKGLVKQHSSEMCIKYSSLPTLQIPLKIPRCLFYGHCLSHCLLLIARMRTVQFGVSWPLVQLGIFKDGTSICHYACVLHSPPHHDRWSKKIWIFKDGASWYKSSSLWYSRKGNS